MKIISVSLDGEDGVLVSFSDGTMAGYVSEELLELRPLRERLPDLLNVFTDYSEGIKAVQVSRSRKGPGTSRTRH